MELLPTISLTKEFPVAQIRLNLQKSFPAESLTNNWMGTKSWGLGASGVRSKVWVLTIRVLEVNPEWDSVWDGLWRPGGAFFQIGLGCVMSHHQSLHSRALHIPVQILAGKFKMEFLPVGH